MDEWELQRRLTKIWVKEGIEVHGTELFLLAWEVMHPSWEINNGGERWDQPSLDFVFCDRRGDLWGLEIKRSITSARHAYCALCQVTTRVVGLAGALRDGDGDGYAKMQDAHMSTWCGHNGRVEHCKRDSVDLRRDHRKFYRLSQPLRPSHFNRGEMRRMVGALRFGCDWCESLHRFNSAKPSELLAQFRKLGIGSHKEVTRFRDHRDEIAKLSQPVICVQLAPCLNRTLV